MLLLEIDEKKEGQKYWILMFSEDTILVSIFEMIMPKNIHAKKNKDV